MVTTWPQESHTPARADETQVAGIRAAMERTGLREFPETAECSATDPANYLTVFTWVDAEGAHTASMCAPDVPAADPLVAALASISDRPRP